MVVAVVAIRMVQVAIDEVVDVVAMRNNLVPAANAVLVRAVMAPTIVLRSALRGIGKIYIEGVLIYVLPVGMVKVAIVKIVGVAVMFYCLMAAALPVRVRMGLVNWMFRIHGKILRPSASHSRDHSLDGYILSMNGDVTRQ